MPIVTDQGFAADAWRRLEEGAPLCAHAVAPVERLGEFRADGAPKPLGVEITPTTEVSTLEPYFDVLALIVAPFANFADGRGFSLARRLRDAGYTGRLRAAGGLIPDQFAFARAAGFDEVEISDDRAQRQPEADWLADVQRPGWYQRNLLNGAAGR
ncbi:MAG: DUF934 domain-containing protein [Neomegalonema sp.]|nr:DUF934 domain-containing protein [Neomegalonema sp.]